MGPKKYSSEKERKEVSNNRRSKARKLKSTEDKCAYGSCGDPPAVIGGQFCQTHLDKSRGYKRAYRERCARSGNSREHGHSSKGHIDNSKRHTDSSRSHTDSSRSQGESSQNPSYNQSSRDSRYNNNLPTYDYSSQSSSGYGQSSQDHGYSSSSNLPPGILEQDGTQSWKVAR
ncbi:hypothetical protein F4818DRAFT_425736 [Hypoxylon cercidicola]|nr:hypothetical protein F4818DRAFT_425736 [Hypoxylon cercidicola]